MHGHFFQSWECLRCIFKYRTKYKTTWRHVFISDPPHQLTHTAICSTAKKKKRLVLLCCVQFYVPPFNQSTCFSCSFKIDSFAVWPTVWPQAFVKLDELAVNLVKPSTRRHPAYLRHRVLSGWLLFSPVSRYSKSSVNSWFSPNSTTSLKCFTCCTTV